MKAYVLFLALIILVFSKPFGNDLENFFNIHLDSNLDGKLDTEDIITFACRSSGKPQHCHVTESMAQYVLDRLDKDGNGFVTFNELPRAKDPIEGGPQQVHLSLTDDPTEMVVMWITKDQDTPSTVQYGTTSNQYSLSATGIIYTYNVGVFGWNGWIHQVTLQKLETNTRYYYKVGSASTSWSNEFYFTTAPGPNDSKFSNNVFAVVADMGTTIPMGWAVTDQMVSDMANTPFSMVMHPGDVCYAGTGDEWEFEEIWDVWGDQMQPLAGFVPYMFAVGNHEHYYNYTSFDSRYLMPGAQCGGNQNFWYSLDYGNVHFTQMSTEHPYEVGSPQYQWLENDLAKANQNRNTKPWLILSGHRPMLNSDVAEWNAHSPGAHLITVIEPLMLKYKVDLYLCGHMHMYERIHPNINGTVVATGNVYTNPTAPAHVVQATGGVFLDDTYEEPQPNWSAFRTNHWGYAQMHVNQTHLVYQFYNEGTYTVMDQFTIIKN